MAKRTWTHDIDGPMQIGAVNQKGGNGRPEKGKDTKKKRPQPRHEDAHVSVVRGKRKVKSESPHADKEFHYCKKLGHLKADCRKLKADQAAGKVVFKGKSGPEGSGGTRSLISEPSLGSLTTTTGVGTVSAGHPMFPYFAPAPPSLHPSTVGAATPTGQSSTTRRTYDDTSGNRFICSLACGAGCHGRSWGCGHHSH